MLFQRPVRFEEAIKDRRLRKVLPTDLSSKEIGQLGADITRRSVLSAKVSHAGVLQRLNELLVRVVSPETVGERAAEAGEYMDIARAREAMKEFLRSIHYMPETAKRGTIEDISSDARINLMLKTGADMSRWAGHYRKSQDRTLLDAFPAQELRRFEARREKRSWSMIWTAKGGRVFAGGSPEFGGRLVALKNDPIWAQISDFGLPYPPFAFGSGIGVVPVDRDDAMTLGLIDRNTHIAPDIRPLNESYESSAEDLSAALQAVIARDPRLRIENGIVKLRDE